jgi:D-alanyl-D-alanine carboxypeptidase
MRPLRRFDLIAAMLAMGAVSAAVAAPPELTRLPPSEAMQVLIRSYPEFLDRVEGNELVWKDGERMVIDDGKGGKPFEELLSAADVKDQFYVAYPLGRTGLPPAINSDPGRVRNARFFDKMYGDCRNGETNTKLIEIDWLPQHGPEKLLVTSVNRVAEKLASVSEELDELGPEFMPYLKPSSGTINCRVIDGTSRVSAHGHGLAIDINASMGEYWRWTKPATDGTYPYKNSIPWEIVEIFEKHGFIWGGKWYHYDTIHFEYRPELLAAGKRL